MNTYTERKNSRRNWVLLENGEVIATFGSLRKICEYVEDDSFPSYWTLIREKDFPIITGEYKIYKVKHI